MRIIHHCLTIAIGLLLALAATTCTSAQAPDWENEQVVGRNKQPGRTTAFPFADKSKAVAGTRNESTWVKSLNGNWLFHWSPDPASRPVEFYQARL